MFSYWIIVFSFNTTRTYIVNIDIGVQVLISASVHITVHALPKLKLNSSKQPNHEHYDVMWPMRIFLALACHSHRPNFLYL